MHAGPAARAVRLFWRGDPRGPSLDSMETHLRTATARQPARSARRPASRGGLRRSLAVCLLGAVVMAVGCAGANARRAERTKVAQKHYEIAVGSFHAGMFEDAKAQLRRALAENPDHADSHYLMGVLLLQEGKSVLDALENERCLTDAAAALQRERAMDLHRRAEASFRKALEHYGPDDAGRGRALNSLAVVALHFDRYDEAIEYAAKALDVQHYNERFSALANLGWAYYGKQDLIRATTELRQAVLLNPDFCVGYYRLARVYMDSDMPDKALEAAETVLANDKCPIQDAHRLAGIARAALGQADQAGEAFASCVALAPRSCLAEDCRSLYVATTGHDLQLASAAPAP
ncbi:MAG: hypothetical protein D6705_03335 [Deltaproteobacteria bacterium]|nr:MAG: hypothetical protein D6705_03335 [Deltaproteobacteria bacterium]